MNKKYFILIIFAFIFVVSCSDNIESKYNDYNSMTKSDSYKKGWIPEFIPTTAKNIYEKHNLDNNNVWIQFYCKKSDLLKISEKWISADSIKYAIKALNNDFDIPQKSSYFKLSDKEFISINYEKETLFYLRTKF